MNNLQEQLQTASKALGIQVAENTDRQLGADPELVVNALANGGKVVLWGGKASNFTYDMRNHPRFVFFDSTDPKAESKELPSNARLVLVIGRWHNHGSEARIRRQAKDRGVQCPPGWFTSGDVRDMLQRFIDKPPVTEPASVAFVPIAPVRTDAPVALPPAPANADATSLQKDKTIVTKTLRPPVRGEIIAAITRHGADFTKARGEEARRIHDAITADGIQTTFGSVCNAIWRAEQLHAREQARQELAERRRAAKAKPVGTDPVGRPAPTVPSADDAMKAQIAKFKTVLADLRAGVELMEAELAALDVEVDRFRDRQQRVQEKARQALRDILE